ncbi:hypothetical protein M1432_03155 [Patescibacteria group bacterium]|nr:hypothetical protein [Patescibacteria group bacterium]
MSKFEKIVSIAVIAATVITPLATLAQVTGITGTPPITSLGQAQGSLTSIINWIITIFWILTVLFLIWAAVLYLTAGGDEDKIGQAKKRVIGAIIAAAIALLSTGLQTIVTRLLQGSTS